MTTKAKNPMEDYDWSQDAGAGFENTDASDFKIPFLQIIQANSPELKKSHAKFIEGATQGAIFNTVTREVVGGEGEPVEVIPCTHWKSYNEWRPKDSGGGLVAIHQDSDILRQCERDEKNHDILPNGNEIVTTSYVACLVLDAEGNTTPAIITFKSTQLKKVSGWLTSMRAIKKTNKEGVSFVVPMYANRWALSTVSEDNERGSWYGWRIEMAGPVEKMEHVLEAKSAKDEAVLLAEGSSNSSRLLVEHAEGEDVVEKGDAHEPPVADGDSMTDEF